MLCFECGAEADHDHHVVPESRGGTRTVPLCARCHGLAHHFKGNMSTGALIAAGIQAARRPGDPWGGAKRVGLNRHGGTRGCARFTPDQWRAFYDRRKAGEALDTIALEAATTVKYLYRKFKAIERARS